MKKGSIFRHLWYPLGKNVTNGHLIEWMSCKLMDKFIYWKPQSWPSHLRLKVVQCIMEPHDIILLAIVAMDKEGVAFCFATSSIFVVEEEG